MIGFWVAAFIVVIAGTSALLWMYISRYQDGYVNGWLDCLEMLGEEQVPKKKAQLRNRYTTSSGKQFFLEDSNKERYVDKRSGFREEDM